MLGECIFRKKIKEIKNEVVVSTDKLKKREFSEKIESMVLNTEISKEQFSLPNFERNLERILILYDCKFGYQNRNSKKHGHLKEKVNLKTGEHKLELKIERNDNLAGKIYTIVHELTHLYNDHLHSKELTYKQKEVVADTVGRIVIKYLNIYEELLNSNLAKKWKVDEYSKNYIYSMKFSKKSEKIIIDQIEKTFLFLKKNFSF